MKGCRANPGLAPAERPAAECAVNSEDMEDGVLPSDFRFPPIAWYILNRKENGCEVDS